MRRLICISSCALLLISCKKDKYTPLNGELDKFVGTWEWIESIGNCGTKYANHCYASPATVGHSIKLIFNGDGEYERYSDNEEIESGGVSIVIRNDGQYAYWQYNMTFIHKRKEDYTAVVFFGNDTLNLSRYPYDYSGENIFVRK